MALRGHHILRLKQKSRVPARTPHNTALLNGGDRHTTARRGRGRHPRAYARPLRYGHLPRRAAGQAEDLGTRWPGCRGRPQAAGQVRSRLPPTD